MYAIQRALLSVYDKTGLVDFARALAARGVELLSTGGTAAALRDAGIAVTPVDSVTGFPEMLDGRVKTLHPAIHGGLLARRDLPEHMEAIAAHGIRPIDLVVINLYPFEATVASGAPFEACIEQIDIGGPSMLRSAAKNHAAVTVVCDPADYDLVLAEMVERGGTSSATRRTLALKVFSTTAAYDAAIAAWMQAQTMEAGALPQHLVISAPKALHLRYGENPHQDAALYGDFFAAFEQLHGKELSYNNLVDIEAAALLVAEFDAPAAAIIKHTNPCGCAVGTDLLDAYRKAHATDPASAYGGIIAVNRTVDVALAEAFNETFSEVVIAPAYDADALDLLQRKRDRRLILRHADVPPAGVLQVKSLRNGYLCQMGDTARDEAAQWRTVSRRAPSDAEMHALGFAWIVAKHVKSNAIVYAGDGRTLGVGAGQMSRVDSSVIAAQKAANARLPLAGCVLASDAFFPFADGLLAAVQAGATAVIQPGGSVRDAEVIAAADAHGIAMVFTGTRHFKH
jgi:phosphoribosylaminoimidazolecarboxamide formyltransferase / IMP cyclohydrolase